MSTVPPDMTFAHFKANYRQVNEIKQYVGATSPKVVLVVGALGAGKSSLYTMLHNEGKYEILLVNDSNFSATMVQNFVNHRTIESFFAKRRKLVFIDDVDAILPPKQLLSTVTDTRSICTVIMTVKSSEEKKFMITCKRIVDHKITLGTPNHKDCFQIVMERYRDDDSIDQERVIALIKAQRCNIANVVMLIDQARAVASGSGEDDTDSNDANGSEPQSANSDIFHYNVYDIVRDVYMTDMSEDYLVRVSNKDQSIICPLIHENLLNVPLSVTEQREIYDVLCDTDLIDRHVYVNCIWNTNWVMNNYLRCKTVNRIVSRKTTRPFDIAFTQQFTRLSSRMNFKKKLALLPSFVQYCNVVDVLHCVGEMKEEGIWFTDDSESAEDAKTLNDMVTKFTKDFKTE